MPYAPASSSTIVEVVEAAEVLPHAPWKLLVAIGLGVAGVVAVLSLIVYTTTKKGA